MNKHLMQLCKTLHSLGLALVKVNINLCLQSLHTLIEAEPIHVDKIAKLLINLLSPTFSEEGIFNYHEKTD